MEVTERNRAGQTDASIADGVSDKVKGRSIDQRLALLGDPKCVICGRYGEYICDETDDDICSLECKQILLRKVANSRSSTRLPATDQCYYVRDADDGPDSLSLTCDQASLLRKKLDIFVKGNFVPPPILSFSSCSLPQKLLQNMEAAGYEMPTAVQMQAIPAAMTGKSLLVSSDTGTGKTASFLVPIISQCACIGLGNPDCKKPWAIVLEPTRELCIQVEDQAKVLGKGLPFKTALVVGGDPLAGQVYRIQQGVELIVGTPGRLIDLLTKHDIELDEVKVFVLDEVDCMLQKGFRDQVMQIFAALSQPQLLMYSATISSDVEKMASSMTKSITVISVGKPSTPTKAVKQILIWVETKNKKQKLFDILTSKQHFTPPAVIYVSSRLGADLLSNAITVTTGIKALSIHGEKPMKERRDIMRSFLMGECPVIVSTGLLDRGVNLLSVKQVIMFDMPNSVREYVHQIGRASRLGEEGQAISFVNEESKNLFPELVELLRSCGAAIPRELQNSRYAIRYAFSGKGKRKRRHGL
ncbi:hypothetical protein SAY86_022216 [Trapa natans]|uniref:DEAD-box ATP-dependent RNA helicase 41 n=1 Tax=Trapa natans TaxID=22666 RepID=A0AAN7MA08_TRANT|nr:hypothetical protein SAY86_022216 [Trapa natans]